MGYESLKSFVKQMLKQKKKLVLCYIIIRSCIGNIQGYKQSVNNNFNGDRSGGKKNNNNSGRKNSSSYLEDCNKIFMNNRLQYSPK